MWSPLNSIGLIVLITVSAYYKHIFERWRSEEECDLHFFPALRIALACKRASETERERKRACLTPLQLMSESETRTTISKMSILSGDLSRATCAGSGEINKYATWRVNRSKCSGDEKKIIPDEEGWSTRSVCCLLSLHFSILEYQQSP